MILIVSVDTPESIEQYATLSPDGLKAMVRMSDQSTEIMNVDKAMLDTSTPGQVTGIVFVGTLFYEFNIWVEEKVVPPATMVSIASVNTPAEIYQNETLDVATLVATVNLSDGTQTNVGVTSVDLNTANLGETTGTVHVENLTFEFTITVIEEQTSQLPSSLKILYQGDSITDASRDWSNLADLGNGYARMISEELEEEYGEDIDFTFVNNAHSGWNLIDNWYEGEVNHYQEQFYDFNADICTILIGYNDIEDAFGSGKTESDVYVSDEAYEAAYDELLAGLKQRGTYAICIGPYFIYDRTDTEYSQPEFAHKRAIVKSLAEKYNFSYIDMKPSMDAAVQAGAAEMELFGDLTHPSYAGNRIIANLVKDELKSLFDPSYVKDPTAGAYSKITGNNDNVNDLTNSRVYCYSSLGDVMYDSSVYYDSEDMESSESLKLTNRGTYQVGTYTQASLVLNSGRDLTGMTLSFDTKVENAIPWMSLAAHSSVWSKNRNKSTEIGFELRNSQRVQALGNGWFHVEFNVDDWVNDDTATNESVLSDVRQIVVTMARGETQSSWQANSIDLTKESALWIDNLTCKQNEGGREKVRGKYFDDTGLAITFERVDIGNVELVLDLKFTNGVDKYACVGLFQEWERSFGWYTIHGDGSVTGVGSIPTIGVTVVNLSDGYVRAKFKLDELSPLATNGGVPEFISLIYIRQEWTTGVGYADFNPLPGIATELRGHAFDIEHGYVFNFNSVNRADGQIILDVYFTDGSDKSVCIGLFQEWDYSFVWYTIYGNGSCEGASGVSTQMLSDGYLRITFTLVDLSDAKTNNGIPTYINHLQIRFDWTTTSGYADLISPAS